MLVLFFPERAVIDTYINPLQTTLIKLAHIYGPKTWPIFRFTLGEYDGYLISSFALCQVIDDPGGGEGLQGNRWFSPPVNMTSRLASVTFNVASKVFIEETNKNFVLITEILFRFLGFRDFKIPVVIENQTLVLFWNETS